VNRRGDGYTDIRADHGDQGEHPKGTTADAVCEEGARDGDKEIPDLEAAVYAGLLVCTGYVEVCEEG
jgi:hypothetical protein